MAYMNQERKAQIAAELKKIMPEGWKWSLRVRHHSTIVLTISQAPVDLIGLSLRDSVVGGYIQLNTHYLEQEYAGALGELFVQIGDALNLKSLGEDSGANWDKSDLMTDYFNVGWYTDIHIGQWNAIFIHKIEAPKPVKAVKVASAPVALPKVAKIALATLACKNKYGKTPAKLMKFDFKNEDWYKTMTPGQKAAYTRKLMAKQAA